MTLIGAKILGLTLHEAEALFEKIQNETQAVEIVRKYANRGRDWKNPGGDGPYRPRPSAIRAL